MKKMHNVNKFSVGDVVVCKRIFPEADYDAADGGWANAWVDSMTNEIVIGKQYTITSVRDAGIECEGLAFTYPSKCFKRVKEVSTALPRRVVKIGCKISFHGEVYMICQVLDNECSLICLNDGNRWDDDFVPVSNPYDITDEELDLLVEGHEFKFVD